MTTNEKAREAENERTGLNDECVNAKGKRLPDSRSAFWVDAVGWLGTLAIVGAYASSSFGWIEDGPSYQALNLFGAIGVGVVCYRRRTWQPFWLEVVWGCVAAVALYRAL